LYATRRGGPDSTLKHQPLSAAWPIDTNQDQQYAALVVILARHVELIPFLQIAPSKTDPERLLVISPELADVLATIIIRSATGTALGYIATTIRTDARPEPTDAAAVPTPVQRRTAGHPRYHPQVVPPSTRRDLVAHRSRRATPAVQVAVGAVVPVSQVAEATWSSTITALSPWC
jgi:hypothetical protein